jgi:hypothetical protein
LKDEGRQEVSALKNKRRTKMVVAESANEYRMITQIDHADLSGQFAAHWGNDKFAQLHPQESMVLAAESHDNGWWYWDANPAVDAKGIPITFRKTPRKILFEYLTKGINSVREKDPYAGLMVSLHLAGLSQQRYGTLPSVPKREDADTLRFVSEQEASHEALKKDLRTIEQYAGANEADYIWFNYRMMEVFDRLSLFFCCHVDLQGGFAGGDYLQSDHESGRAYYGSSIKPTPVEFGCADEELQLHAIGKEKVVVTPYPFDQAPLKVSVRGRLIPRKSYKTQEEFKDVFRRAPREMFEMTLVPA